MIANAFIFLILIGAIPPWFMLLIQLLSVSGCKELSRTRNTKSSFITPFFQRIRTEEVKE